MLLTAVSIAFIILSVIAIAMSARAIKSSSGTGELRASTPSSVDIQHDTADYKLKYKDSAGVTQKVVTEGIAGQTLTTPNIIATVSSVTGTGATGGAGGVLPTVTPAFVTVSGASGSGVDLPTGPAGAVYFINNKATGALNLYCVGGTINGTTGTTAYPITATGNHCAWAYCKTATGAWEVAGNT